MCAISHWIVVRALSSIVTISAFMPPDPILIAWLRLSQEYREESAYHLEKERKERQLAKALHELLKAGRAEDPVVAVRCERLAVRRADFHAKMGKKYAECAARPWLPVDRDPEYPIDRRLIVGDLDSLAPIKPIDAGELKTLEPDGKEDPPF